MREHMKYADGTLSKRDWINWLDEQGLVPLVRILDTASNKQTAEIKELRYMYHAVQQGQPLTNGEIVLNVQRILDLQTNTSINWLTDMDTAPPISFREDGRHRHCQCDSCARSSIYYLAIVVFRY